MSLTFSTTNSTLAFSFNVTQVAGSTPTGSVTADDTTPLTGAIVTFTPAWVSITPTNWSLDFGDGNVRSTTASTITHKYRNPGTYTVKLFAGSATLGIPVNTQTGYIVASEDDLTAYGTLGSWVNFQDDSMVTINGSNQITNVNDNVTGLDWISNIGSLGYPHLRQSIDDNGIYKYMYRLESYGEDVTQVGSSPGSGYYEVLQLDDSGDQLAVETSTGQAHYFLLLSPQGGLISNNRVISAVTGGCSFFLTAYTSYKVKTTQNVTKVMTNNNHKFGSWVLHEIVINAGTITYYMDGVLEGTETSRSGNFGFLTFGDNVSAQHFIGKCIGWAAFDGNLTGANLTAVRAYFNNKKPNTYD